MDASERAAGLERTRAYVATLAPPLRSWRCAKCGRLLARLALVRGCAVEVKCGACGTLNIASVDKPKPTA